VVLRFLRTAAAPWRRAFDEPLLPLAPSAAGNAGLLAAALRDPA
jgi:hypothetical protein